MQRINTRTELISFICQNIRQSAIVRACHNGTVKVLGGFAMVPPSTRPGWIIAVTSASGRTWFVAVTSDDHRHVFKAWIVKSIPWQYYVGRVNRGEYSIYDGDNPGQACLARDTNEIQTIQRN